jgi:DNA-binding MarR family transcriptional regulator
VYHFACLCYCYYLRLKRLYTWLRQFVDFSTNNVTANVLTCQQIHSYIVKIIYWALIDEGLTLKKTHTKPAAFPHSPRENLTDDLSAPVHISYVVTLVANLMAFGGSSANFKRFGVNIREWRVLGTLGVMGPVTASRIVEVVHQDKANISRAIAELAKKDLVVKLPNTQHKSSPLIWMSEAGAELYKRIVPVFTQQAESFTSVLSNKEQKQLCHLLDKLNAHIVNVRRDENLG